MRVALAVEAGFRSVEEAPVINLIAQGVVEFAAPLALDVGSVSMKVFEMGVSGPAGSASEFGDADLHNHSARPVVHAVLNRPALVRADATRIRSAAPASGVEAACFGFGFGVAVGAFGRMRLCNRAIHFVEEAASIPLRHRDTRRAAGARCRTSACGALPLEPLCGPPRRSFDGPNRS